MAYRESATGARPFSPPSPNDKGQRVGAMKPVYAQANPLYPSLTNSPRAPTIPSQPMQRQLERSCSRKRKRGGVSSAFGGAPRPHPTTLTNSNRTPHKATNHRRSNPPRKPFHPQHSQCPLLGPRIGRRSPIHHLALSARFGREQSIGQERVDEGGTVAVAVGSDAVRVDA